MLAEPAIAVAASEEEGDSTHGTKQLASENIGFLSRKVEQALALVGAGGVVLTAIGVFLAWWQIRKTASASVAATRAAVDALNDLRGQYNDYMIRQASRILNETRVYVHELRWSAAVIRLNDLADLFMQVSGDDQEWKDIALRLHSMETSIERIAKAEGTFTKSLEGKWRKLQRDIRVKIAVNDSPFPVNQQESN